MACQWKRNYVIQPSLMFIKTQQNLTLTHTAIVISLFVFKLGVNYTYDQEYSSLMGYENIVRLHQFRMWPGSGLFTE